MNILYFTSLAVCIVLIIYIITCTNIKAHIIELLLIVLSIIPIINTFTCTGILIVIIGTAFNWFYDTNPSVFFKKNKINKFLFNIN